MRVATGRERFPTGAKISKYIGTQRETPEEVPEVSSLANPQGVFISIAPVQATEPIVRPVEVQLKSGGQSRSSCYFTITYLRSGS